MLAVTESGTVPVLVETAMESATVCRRLEDEPCGVYSDGIHLVGGMVIEKH